MPLSSPKYYGSIKSAILDLLTDICKNNYLRSVFSDSFLYIFSEMWKIGQCKVLLSCQQLVSLVANFFKCFEYLLLPVPSALFDEFYEKGPIHTCIQLKLETFSYICLKFIICIRITRFIFQIQYQQSNVYMNENSYFDIWFEKKLVVFKKKNTNTCFEPESFQVFSFFALIAVQIMQLCVS